MIVFVYFVGLPLNLRIFFLFKEVFGYKKKETKVYPLNR